MNEEIILGLKQRAEEMLIKDYSRKIGDEEIYTIICEWKKLFDLYNKEKEKNKKIIENCAKFIEGRDTVIQQNRKEILDYVKDKYISKDKIKEKIKELEKIKKEEEKTKFVLSYSIYDSITNEIDVLEELLEE